VTDEQQEETREEAQAEGGGDTAEDKDAKSEDQQEPAGGSDEDAQSESKDPDDMSASEKAQKEEEEREEAKETMEKLEKEGAPDNIEDWPSDKAKYETFGGAEGGHSYHEGPEEEQLGPSSLRHHEDGKVSIAGEEVDNPDDYKSDPIPGGPTDEQSNDPSAGGETDDDDDDSDDSDDSESEDSDDKEEAEA
jgi:nucleolin